MKTGNFPGWIRGMIPLMALLAALWLLPAAAAATEYYYLPDTGDGVDYSLDEYPFYIQWTGEEPAVNKASVWKVTFREQSRFAAADVARMEARLNTTDYGVKEDMLYSWKQDGFRDEFPCCTLVQGGAYELKLWIHFKDGSTRTASCRFSLMDPPGQKTVETAILEAVKACKTDSEWQTALNLYQWLLDHLVYDKSMTFYGADAILRGTGVCDSYSRLYFMLCREAGLQARIVRGQTSRDKHGWDAVRIDGEWYYCDPTWDDTDEDPARKKEPEASAGAITDGCQKYHYFCLNRQLMEMADHKTFEWMTEDGDDITDDDTKVPEQPCVSLAANWYIHTGEWKKWTVYPGKTAAGQAETILGKTASALNRGENLWAWSSLAQNVWGVAGQEGVFRPTTYEMILLSYALSGQRLTLADGRSVEIVAVVHHPDESLYVENIGVKGGGAELAPTKLTLPKGMETIAARAFEGMSEVYEIRLPEGLKTIGSRAFADCPVLQAVYIPSSVTQIAADAFDGSETCIQTDRRNSEAARFAEAHDLNCIADDDPPVEEGENG